MQRESGVSRGLAWLLSTADWLVSSASSDARRQVLLLPEYRGQDDWCRALAVMRARQVFSGAGLARLVGLHLPRGRRRVEDCRDVQHATPAHLITAFRAAVVVAVVRVGEGGEGWRGWRGRGGRRGGRGKQERMHWYSSASLGGGVALSVWGVSSLKEQTAREGDRSHCHSLRVRSLSVRRRSPKGSRPRPRRRGAAPRGSRRCSLGSSARRSSLPASGSVAMPACAADSMLKL